MYLFIYRRNIYPYEKIIYSFMLGRIRFAAVLISDAIARVPCVHTLTNDIYTA